MKEDLDLSRPTRELVPEVASRIFAAGDRPTLDKIRAVIGKGSATTIQSALNEWWETLGKRFKDQAHHPALPDAIADAANTFWTAALKEAEAALARHREEADARVVAAENSKRQAEEAMKAAEEEKKTAMGALDSANATIDGLERTLAAESAHKASLEQQGATLRAEAADARQEAEQARRDAAQEIERVRKDASEQIERAAKEYREQMDLAQARFESVQKRMLVEIDRERQETITARQERQKEIEGVRTEAHLTESKLRQRNNELTDKVSMLTAQVARTEGQIEEVSKQRDHLLAEAAVTVSAKRRDREARKALADEIRRRRMKKNTPIFEEHHDEIVARLEAGKKSGEIAAWLNGMGFEGGGAALNALLKQAGLW